MAYTLISTENVFVLGQLDSASESITVPADCTTIVCCHGGYPTANAIMDYFTIDGDDGTHVGGVEEWQYICAGMAVLHNPSTGAQTVTFAVDANGGGNTNISSNNLEFIYLKGLDTTQTSGFDVKESASGSGTDHSPANITVESGKVALCVSCSWAAQYNSNDQTSVVIRNVSGDDSDISVDRYDGDGSSVEMGGVYSSSSQWAAVAAEFTESAGGGSILPQMMEHS